MLNLVSCVRPVADPTPNIRATQQAQQQQEEKAARDSDRKEAKAAFDRGYAYSKMGDYQKAVIEYTNGIGLSPGLANFYINRGNAYRNLGEYQTAIADYTKAIQIGGSYDALAYVGRGLAYSNLGEYERAIEDYDKAIQL